jgi:hypothetical protein
VAIHVGPDFSVSRKRLGILQPRVEGSAGGADEVFQVNLPSGL